MRIQMDLNSMKKFSDMISSTISQIRDCYHIDPADIIKQ